MPKIRRSNNNQAMKTLRIFCEGAKTEPHYIEGYIGDHFPSNRISVVKVEQTKKNTPIQLVEVAISLKKSNRSLPGDQFWVVYDRESEAKYSRERHAEAWDKAKKAGVNVALSNVCFEFWILLHLVDTASAYSCCDDLLKRSSLKAELKKRWGIEYEKASRELYSKLKDFIPQARIRAKRLVVEQSRAAGAKSSPFDINPWTDLHELLDAIDAFK